MEMLLLNSNSKKDINLLVQLASKIGIKTHLLTEKEKEDLAMGLAIKNGKTNEYVDTKQFINKLRS